MTHGPPMGCLEPDPVERPLSHPVPSCVRLPSLLGLPRLISPSFLFFQPLFPIPLTGRLNVPDQAGSPSYNLTSLVSTIQGWLSARTCQGGRFPGASHLRWRPSPDSVPTASPPTPASFLLKPEPNKVGGQAGEPRPEEARQKRTEKPAPWHLSGI